MKELLKTALCWFNRRILAYVKNPFMAKEIITSIVASQRYASDFPNVATNGLQYKA